jgi:hypothetical protein
MSQGADPVRILGGLLLLLFGICLVGVGGLCTFFMLENLRGAMVDGGGLLLLSVGTLALGILSIVAGVKCFMPPR